MKPASVFFGICVFCAAVVAVIQTSNAQSELRADRGEFDGAVVEIRAPSLEPVVGLDLLEFLPQPTCSYQSKNQFRYYGTNFSLRSGSFFDTTDYLTKISPTLDKKAFAVSEDAKRSVTEIVLCETGGVYTGAIILGNDAMVQMRASRIYKYVSSYVNTPSPNTNVVNTYYSGGSSYITRHSYSVTEGFLDSSNTDHYEMIKRLHDSTDDEVLKGSTQNLLQNKFADKFFQTSLQPAGYAYWSDKAMGQGSLLLVQGHNATTPLGAFVTDGNARPTTFLSAGHTFNFYDFDLKQLLKPYDFPNECPTFGTRAQFYAPGKKLVLVFDGEIYPLQDGRIPYDFVLPEEGSLFIGCLNDDSDRDGLPDVWEEDQGLDPHAPNAYNRKENRSIYRAALSAGGVMHHLCNRHMDGARSLLLQ